MVEVLVENISGGGGLPGALVDVLREIDTKVSKNYFL
jgi:hypothetical protein